MSEQIKKILIDAGVELPTSASTKADRAEYVKIMLKWFLDH